MNEEKKNLTESEIGEKWLRNLYGDAAYDKMIAENPELATVATPDTRLKEAEGERDALQKAATEFANDIHEGVKDDSYFDTMGSFREGANWQHTQSKAEIERLKEEVKRMQYGSELYNSGYDQCQEELMPEIHLLKEENAALKAQVENVASFVNKQMDNIEQIMKDEGDVTDVEAGQHFILSRVRSKLNPVSEDSLPTENKPDLPSE